MSYVLLGGFISWYKFVLPNVFHLTETILSKRRGNGKTRNEMGN